MRPWSAGKAAYVALAAAVVVTLGACDADSSTPSASQSLPASNGSPSAPPPSASPPVASPTPARAPSQPLLAAGATALQRVAGTRVMAIESDRDGTAWEAHLITADGSEREVVLSRDGNAVLAGPTVKGDSLEDKAEHRQRLNAARLDYRAAVGKALATVPGGTVTNLGLDNHDAMTVWEADVFDPAGAKHSLKINAGSGAVVGHEIGD